MHEESKQPLRQLRSPEELGDLPCGFPATVRQRRFCEEYVRSWNIKQAALKAGYSESFARSKAGQMVKTLMPFIALLQGDKERALGFAQKDLERILARIASAALDDFHEFYEDNGRQRIRGKPWESIPEQKRVAVAEVWYDEFGNLRYRLHPKDKATYLLGKYFGMFNEKLIIERRNVDVRARFDFSGFSTDELKQLERTLMRARGMATKAENEDGHTTPASE